MKFFLTGVETNNKGAELMLYAILQEIESKYPKSTIYIEQNHVKQGKNYIHTSLHFKLLDNPIEDLIKRSKLNKLLKRMHLPLLHHRVNVPKIDYLIDGSGLHFTDQMHRKDHFSYWNNIVQTSRDYGAKIIFLPQGFGPVNKESTLKVLKLLSDNADLICARENVSYDYLNNSSVVDMSKVRIYPDFTTLVKGVFPSKYEYLRNGVCIIPNVQMINQGLISFESYIVYIKLIIEEVIRTGNKAYLLNHQGNADERLLLECKERMHNSIEIVTGLNALETKGLISTAYLVITSRFHGLASALNSNVPSLATSWNHKYQCLFNEHGQDECVLSLNDIKKDLAKIRSFLDPIKNQEIRIQLNKYIQPLKEENLKMWNDIWSL